jgi:glycosyltransferase-like protein
MSPRPLRIALLMHSLNPRGGVVHTLELADALVAQGHAVTVIAAGRPGQALFRPTAATLSVAPLGELPTALVPMVSTRMQAVAQHLRGLNLSGFDVLHSQDSITANALADLQAEGRIPGFWRTVHHLDAFDDAQLSAWQARGVHAARQLLCVSALWQQALAQDWGRPAHRVSNGVNLARYQPVGDATQRQADAQVLAALGLSDGAPFWLAVGGVEARKNTARLLQAFALLRPTVPLARLVIVGGATLLEHAQAQAEFNAIRQAHGMAPGQPHASCLVLTGPVPDGVLPALYRQATALAMPSVKEGFGLVAIEAMACGTPAIVSRIAPFTEHLQPHEAFWVDPLDAHDIAHSLRQSLSPTQHALRARGARQVAARFDWQACAHQHLAIYRAGLNGAVPPPRPHAITPPLELNCHA